MQFSHADAVCYFPPFAQSSEAFREARARVPKLLIRALGVLLICGGLVGLAFGLAFTVECPGACGEGGKPPIIFALTGLAIASMGLKLLLHRETDTRTSGEKRMDSAREAHRRDALNRKRQEMLALKRARRKR